MKCRIERNFKLFILILCMILPVKSYSNEDQAYYHYALGEMYILDNDIKGAIKEYKIALKHTDNSSYIRTRLAYAFFQNDAEKQATTEIKRAIELDRENIDAKNLYAEILIWQKHYDEALEVCNSILEVDALNTRAIHYKAILLTRINKKKSALNLLKDYTAQKHDDEFAYYYIATIYHSSFQDKKAEMFYKKTLSINSNYEPAIAGLLALYKRIKNKKEVIKKLEELISLNPQYTEIAGEIAKISFKLASSEKSNTTKTAKEYYKKTLDYLNILENEYPENPDIKIQKALTYEKSGAVDKAIEVIEASLKTLPEDERLLYHLGMLFDKSKRRDEALSIMEKIIKLYPNNPHALNHVGYTYAERNIKLKEAKKLISKALTLLPEDPYILDSLGWVYYKMGDTKNALKYLEKASMILHDSNVFEPEIAEHLLHVYTDMGLKNKAKNTYKQLLSSDISNDKRTEIKNLVERLDEIPERKPAGTEDN